MIKINSVSNIKFTLCTEHEAIMSYFRSPNVWYANILQSPMFGKTVQLRIDNISHHNLAIS